MSESGLLTPREAEAVIDDHVEQSGPGALPHVSVTELADGTWQVRWQHLESNVRPMTLDAWCAWITRNVASLDPGDLQTTESRVPSKQPWKPQPGERSACIWLLRGQRASDRPRKASRRCATGLTTSLTAWRERRWVGCSVSADAG